MELCHSELQKAPFLLHPTGTITSVTEQLKLYEYLVVPVIQASREFPFHLEIQVSQGFLAALGRRPVLANLCVNNESLLVSVLQTGSPKH